MKIVKIAVLTAFVTCCLDEVRADQTNVVQNLSVQLFGVKAGGPVTTRASVTTGIGSVRIDTRDIIQALGTATGNSFFRPARLVIVTPVEGGDAVVQVRDGSKKVDVTRYFLHEQLSEAVSGSVSNIPSHRVVDLDYSIQRFALRNAEESPALTLRFDVSGFAAERTAGRISQLLLDVSGTGETDGNLLILRGNIEVQGDRLEVVPDDSGTVT